MQPEAYAIGTLALSVVGLLWDAVVQRRHIRSLSAHLRLQGERLALCEVAGDDAGEQLRKQDARIDRLTRMVTDRGWRDSLDLTRFDWEKKGRQ